MDIRKFINVALDVDTLGKAFPLVDALAPHVNCFKVGLELLTAEGAPRVVDSIHSLGGQVFYDGKFDDIPETVGKASKVVAALGVKMFNVHASAGIEALKAAADNKGNSLLLAVTVLTSLDEEDCLSIFGAGSEAKVLQFAEDAMNAGCDGLVCSPLELKLLNGHRELERLLKFTPGIRPAWAVKGDQKRITTPADAVRAGATGLVIGRPITQPPEEIGTPLDAALKITEELVLACG